MNTQQKLKWIVCQRHGYLCDWNGTNKGYNWTRYIKVAHVFPSALAATKACEILEICAASAVAEMHSCRTSHSPLPWRSGPAGDELSSVLNVPKGTILIAAKRSNGSWDHVASLAHSAEPEANAAFIVRACNEYEQLLAECQRVTAECSKAIVERDSYKAHAQRLADALKELVRTIQRDNMSGRHNITKARKALAQWEKESPVDADALEALDQLEDAQDE